jgi:comEA protein
MRGEKQKGKFNFWEWVEKYKFWVGGGLLILILAGCGVLYWKENIAKPNMESRMKSLEERISDLENQKSEALSTKSETNINSENSNVQNTSQGQVAGAESNGIPDQVRDDNTSKTQAVQGKVNLNTASAAQLDTLPGIGATYAQRIIDYRNTHGGFKSIEEIKNVKGIGDKTFEKLRELISV